MTIIEIDNRSLEFEDAIAVGAQLSIARDGLRRFLAQNQQPEEDYTAYLVDYLNCFQKQHFDGQARDELRKQEQNLMPTALIMKHEVSCILGKRIDDIEDIQLLLKGNLDDEFSMFIEDAGCHPLPRSVSMTLFELIEDNR